MACEDYTIAPAAEQQEMMPTVTRLQTPVIQREQFARAVEFFNDLG